MRADVGRRYEMVYGNEVLALKSSSFLAAALRRTTGSIRLLIRHGAIPDTPFKRERDGGVGAFRLWTTGQIEAVTAVVSKHVKNKAIARSKYDAIRTEIEARWQEQGIPVGTEVSCINAEPA